MLRIYLSCSTHLAKWNILTDKKVSTMVNLVNISIKQLINKNKTERLYIIGASKRLVSYKNILPFYSLSSVADFIVDILMSEYPDIGMETICQWYRKESFSAMGLLHELDLAVMFYTFSEIERIRGKRVILYGAGKVGLSYYTQLSRYKDIDIVSWIDRNYSNFRYEFCQIEDITVGLSNKYDYIVVAVLHEDIAEAIFIELQDRGVEKSKILWVKPRYAMDIEEYI